MVLAPGCWAVYDAVISCQLLVSGYDLLVPPINALVALLYSRTLIVTVPVRVDLTHALPTYVPAAEVVAQFGESLSVQLPLTVPVLLIAADQPPVWPPATRARPAVALTFQPLVSISNPALPTRF